MQSRDLQIIRLTQILVYKQELAMQHILEVGIYSCHLPHFLANPPKHSVGAHFNKLAGIQASSCTNLM